ncbi:hypothetical protein FN846DRAFT_931829 [Sphaerosporella brunnea]|uniref:rRNA biogenesis protein RRP5 n=1 Tax=Sphaerosporella brunnea TaxID=1250544 RepID=A0A5J5F707_9PEZI|nr:hypothetical protein FN846DRAFT_931829 [Sphaerosporella brunnea]
MAPEKKRKRPQEASTHKLKPTPKPAPESSNKRLKGSDSKPAAAPAVSSAPSALKSSRDEEAAFPRGGASVLTPLEYKEVANEAMKDALFESGGAAVSAKGNDAAKSKKKPRHTDKRKGKKGVGTKEKRETGPRVEGLSYKRLVPGTMVLGCVERINSTDIALSLPNNLTGFIPITQISEKVTKRIEAMLEDSDDSKDEEEGDKPEADEDAEEDAEKPESDDVQLDSMFKIGQYLRAYILHAKEEVAVKGPQGEKSASRTRKRIELSLEPKLANTGIAVSDLAVGITVQASVVSVEDHGLVMDMGIGEDLKGFLSSNELGSFKLEDIKEGQVLLCTVTGLSSNGKIVKLSADLEQKFSKKGKLAGGKASWWLTQANSIGAFLPGTGVEVLVTEVGKQGGVVGTIMGMLDAVADFFHVAGWDEKELEEKVKIGSKIKARITTLFPNTEAKKVVFSILPHVLSLTPASETHPLTALPIATIVDQAKIIGVEPAVGLFVDVGVPGIPGFVHISRISSDEKVENLEKTTGPYKIGATHPARILGFNPMDGLLVLSMEKRVLEQPYLRIDDIKIGEVIKGKIEKILGRGGIVINVADGINGVVEEDHLSDVKLKNPEKKFRVGMEVRARVLATSPERRKLRLTLKKTLVNSDLPIIASYNVEPGTQSVGTLVNILPTGAVVKFYAGVTAFLPVSEMSEAYIQNPAEHFRVGQSVNVNVLTVDAEEKKMRVSCKDPGAFGEDQKNALADLKFGQIVSGKISEKSNDDLIVELEGVGASGLKGVIMMGQLTDGSREKNMNTLRKFRAGQTLNDLVVMDKHERRRMIHLSMKPSLVAAAKDNTLIHSFEQIHEGAIVKGYIKSTADIGAFVSFAGGIVGLALRNALPLEKQPLPGFGYLKHQSVTGRVIAMDMEEQKFLLSLKPINESQATLAVGKSKVAAREAVNAIDGVSTSVDDYQPGKITKAKIISVQTTQINVQLADNVQGRIDVSQIFNSWSDIKDKKSPLSGLKLKKGAIMDVKVIGLHDARNHRFLAISHRTSSNKTPIFELTAKPSAIVPGALCETLTLDKVAIGSSWLAFVNNIADDCMWVNISPDIRGRIRLLDITDDVSQLKDVEKHFPIGSALRCTVVNADAEKGKLDLSAKGSSVQKLDFDGLSKGMVVPGRVTKVLDRQVLVQLSDAVVGVINLIDIADDFTEAKVSNFQKNDVVRVCVIDVDKSSKRVSLSTRPSKVLDSKLPIKDAEVTAIRDVQDRELRRGFVKNVSDKGLFVSLGANVTAWVKVSDLADTFLKDWKSKFQVDQVVEGRIVAVDYPLGHIQMSLRPSAISGKIPEKQSGLGDFTKGQIVTGKIKKVAEYGVFVSIDGSNVSGLCHKSQIADRQVEDISKLYAEGDPVKAKILSIDMEKRRISFGLKASYFKDDDFDSEDGGMELDEEEGAEDEDDSDDESTGGIDLSHVKDIEMDEDEDEDEDDESDVQMEDAPVLGGEGLSAGGFDWTANNIFEKRECDEESDSDEEDKKKRRKRRSEIKKDLTGDMISREPQSVTDFERLVLGDPNDSKLWIQFMAFQLQLGEVEKAREIAERAIKTILQKEDAERRNVWVALLNMENAYGDDETLDATLKRAVQYNDAQDIHERMTSIFIQSGKTEKADDLFKTMVKKFSQVPKVWANYADFLLSNGNRVAARELLKRAMQALPREQHRDLIIRFASMEFRTGDPERGRTLFENLIGAYNKRMDIWNVFIDMEMKHGGENNANGVRTLYKRAVADEKCTPKQAAALFKKWKELEEKLGNEKGVQDVVVRAKAYVAAKKGGAAAAAEDEE